MPNRVLILTCMECRSWRNRHEHKLRLPDRRTPTEEMPGGGRSCPHRRFENWRLVECTALEMRLCASVLVTCCPRKSLLSGHFAPLVAAPSHRLPSHTRQLGSKMVAVSSRIVRACSTCQSHPSVRQSSPEPVLDCYCSLKAETGVRFP
jgi:hypothetical protein